MMPRLNHAERLVGLPPHRRPQYLRRVHLRALQEALSESTTSNFEAKYQAQRAVRSVMETAKQLRERPDA